MQRGKREREEQKRDDNRRNYDRQKSSSFHVRTDDLSKTRTMRGEESNARVQRRDSSNRRDSHDHDAPSDLSKRRPQHKQERPREKAAISNQTIPQAYIEPGSAADLYFNTREIMTKRTAKRVINAVQQIFKKVLESGNYQGFIYFAIPTEKIEILRIFTYFGERYSCIEFYVPSKGESVRGPKLDDGKEAIFSLDDCSIIRWTRLPLSNDNDFVKKYCEENSHKWGNACFRINLENTMKTPVPQRSTITYFH